jgi:hypothetical protein
MIPCPISFDLIKPETTQYWWLAACQELGEISLGVPAGILSSPTIITEPPRLRSTATHT